MSQATKQQVTSAAAEPSAKITQRFLCSVLQSSVLSALLGDGPVRGALNDDRILKGDDI